MLKEPEKIWENRGKLDIPGLYQISNEYGFSLPFSAILQKRKINIQEFMDNDFMYSPLLLPDIKKAADIITDRIKREKKVKIAVVNDYDVDGATSGVIMKEILDYLGADAFIITPNRDIDGYGISFRIIDEIIKAGCNFIITTDNGIAAKDQTDYAKGKGITVIVTDHHEVPFYYNEGGQKIEILPNADAIIDPKRAVSQYPFKEICGAMVAYKLAGVLLDGVPGLHPEEYERLMNRWCELAGIGTVCDVMPLVSENRTVVKKAIDLIKQGSSFIGIRQLIKAQSLNLEKFNAGNIGFGIGPCINACGRMTGSVDLATALLLEKDFAKASKYAEKMKKLNDERKKLSAECEKEALEMAGGMAEDTGIYIIYLPDKSPHIMGIVAGRIKEATGHPCICVTDSEDGILKGSGRSVPGYNMFERMSKIKELYETFGGHELAVGISFKKDRLKKITGLLNEDMKDIPKETFAIKTQVDLFMDMQKVTMGLLSEIDTLEPSGNGNEGVVFGKKDITVEKLSRMGADKNYIKMQLKEGDSRIEAVYFGNAEQFDHTFLKKYGQAALDNIYKGIGNFKMDFLYRPSVNTWNGRTSIQYIIRDYR
jgi:single-stranded-DNA-specific exonuclease